MAASKRPAEPAAVESKRQRAGASRNREAGLPDSFFDKPAAGEAAGGEEDAEWKLFQQSVGSHSATAGLGASAQDATAAQSPDAPVPGEARNGGDARGEDEPVDLRSALEDEFLEQASLEKRLQVLREKQAGLRQAKHAHAQTVAKEQETENDEGGDDDDEGDGDGDGNDETDEFALFKRRT